MHGFSLASRQTGALTILRKCEKLQSMTAKMQLSSPENPAKSIVLNGLLGYCGGKKVFLGFAPANLLYQLSVADVLQEETGKGYQRRFSERHSLDFRKYIQKDGSTTIPLTFNLRPRADSVWKLLPGRSDSASLEISTTAGKVLSQVDCQHRLGHLADLEIPLAFMTFIGLSIKEEMRIFSIINGKAKGLSTSLLDFHETRLIEDLGSERPELYIALRLNDDGESPWHKQLDLGGNQTCGLKRRASLRTMQKAVKRFLRETDILKSSDIGNAYEIMLSFWTAISMVMEVEWKNPRKYFITKGIGVYSLSSLAALLYLEAKQKQLEPSRSYFSSILSDFISTIDWSNNGCFKGFGGESGAEKAFGLICQARTDRRRRII